MHQIVLIFSIYYSQKKTHFGYEGIRMKYLKNQTRKKISNYVKPLYSKLF